MRFRTDLLDDRGDIDRIGLQASEPGPARGCLDGSTLMERLMNTLSRTILMGAALAMLLAGCQKKDEPAVASTVQPSATVTNNSAPIPQTSTPDPSLPEAAGNAGATQTTTALQRNAAPQGKMTKQEESKAMPLPGQANDHSTTALDKSKSK